MLLSQIALVALSAGWLRSDYRSDAVVGFGPNGFALAWASSDGVVRLGSARMPVSSRRSWQVAGFITDSDLIRSYERAVFSMPVHDYRLAGFDLSYCNHGLPADGPNSFAALVAIPYAFLVLLAALPQFRALWLFRRLRLRVKRGQCSACGYDLRASPEQCPECGKHRTGSPLAA